MHATIVVDVAVPNVAGVAVELTNVDVVAVLDDLVAVALIAKIVIADVVEPPTDVEMKVVAVVAIDVAAAGQCVALQFVVAFANEPNFADQKMVVGHF